MDMDKTLNILGISGSLRKGSYNTHLLYEAGRLLPEGMMMEIADLATLPLFNQDLVDEAGTYPSMVHQFREKIKIADALVMATPEYNYSVSGVLKNAIDWASRPDVGAPRGTSPLVGKPLAILGAGGRVGGSRAQYHLRQIAQGAKMVVVTQPEVIVFLLPRAPFDEQGNLTDEHTRMQIAQLMESLKLLTLQLRHQPALV